MLEPLIRDNLTRLQPLYDYAPSPARTLLASARGWFLTQVRYCSSTAAVLSELRCHESWSAEEMAGFQLRQIQQTVDHARRTVPFYKYYPSTSIRKFDDLRQFPILEREVVRRDAGQFLSTSVSRGCLIRVGTTGTTGANLKVAYTEELARANWAILLRQWSWAGISARQPRITLFGARVVPAKRATIPFWIHNFPERQILMSIFHISERTAPAYLDFLRAHSGVVLEGFPSVLGILADFAIRGGTQIPMRVVFTSGEPLYPEVREQIGSVFQAPVYDSYGMTEYCGSIQECEHAGMHLIPEFGFLEIVDDTGNPAAPGGEGHFLWTGFLNRAMPLIRYRIGDRGLWSENLSCPCGRVFPLVTPTITRESDILRCPDGRSFSPRALNQFLKESRSLRFCQFVHDRPERVVVRAVACGIRADNELEAIRSGLQALLGPAINVIVEEAELPIARPGGKIPLIVNQIRK